MAWESFDAMGTRVDVLGDGVVDVAALFETVEAAGSRFRPDSELSRMNRGPLEARVAPLLADVISAAAEARDLSGGLVDAGMGRILESWGYDRTFSAVEDRSDAPAARPAGRWEVDADVVRRDPGVEIDLGGIAKGWTADLALERTPALAVSAGGDLASRHPDLMADIESPFGSGTVARIPVGVGGLATSTTAKRGWQAAGRRAHHLLDPWRGAPSDSPVVQATAVAGSAFHAEVAAKTMILMGEDALVWADTCSWVRGALIVWQDGGVYATTGTGVAA